MSLKRSSVFIHEIFCCLGIIHSGFVFFAINEVEKATFLVALEIIALTAKSWKEKPLLSLQTRSILINEVIVYWHYQTCGQLSCFYDQLIKV